MSYLSKLKPHENNNYHQKYGETFQFEFVEHIIGFFMLDIIDHNDQGCTGCEAAILFSAE